MQLVCGADLGFSRGLALNLAFFKATSPLSRATHGTRLEIFSQDLPRRAENVRNGGASPPTTLRALL